MAESIVFVLIGAVITSVVIVALGWHEWVDPHWLVFGFFLILVPGLWGAFTTGPYVPSGKKRRESMLRLAKLQPNDIVYELGCGDGSLIFAAAPKVSKAIGYEISIPLVLFGKLRKWFSRSRVHIRFGNIWKQNYRDADVLFCYLMPNSMKRLYHEIWPTLKPGARLVTHAFYLPELQPIAKEEGVYLYQV